MRITDTVKIGGIVYDVEKQSLIDNDPNCQGQIEFAEQRITLRGDLDHDKDFAKEVFLHEILHGIFEHCGLKHNENMIHSLSLALYMVIEDNPRIFSPP